MGAPTAALCRLLARRVGVGVGSVSVVHGGTSREKVVRVDGLSAEEVR
jgi:uncharacterized protein YggU (UPF0235/DUF167 family)